MESKSSKRRLESRSREDAALELRKRGLTHVEISRELGVSDTTAYNLTKRAVQRLMEHLNESAAEVRKIEEGRLDALLNAVWLPAMKGDPKAILAALRVSESRRKLLGVDAPPPQQEVKFISDTASVQAELLQRLNAVAAPKGDSSSPQSS